MSEPGQLDIFEMIEQTKKPVGKTIKLDRYQARMYGPIPFTEILDPVEEWSKHGHSTEHMRATWSNAVWQYFRYPVTWEKAMKKFEEEREIRRNENHIHHSALGHIDCDR